MRGNPWAGMMFFWHGLSRLGEPGLRRYVALPLLLNVLIMSLASWWGISTLHEQMGALVEWLPGWLSWLYWLLLPLTVITLLLLLMYFFSTVLIILASPFNGLLSEQVERSSGVMLPEESIPALIRRTLGREMTKLGYLLPRYLLLLVLSVIPGINLAAPFLWFWFGSWVVALQYIDYSFDNHGRSFAEVRQAMGQERFTVLGFGALVALLMTVPVLNWFVMPAAVIGATLLRQQRLPLADSAGKADVIGYAERVSE